jgi:acyl-coenzyme A synthetase/AMP-(fatty) acid ligase
MVNYKVVREVKFLEEIPKTATGKLMKRKWKEMFI